MTEVANRLRGKEPSLTTCSSMVRYKAIVKAIDGERWTSELKTRVITLLKKMDVKLLEDAGLSPFDAAQVMVCYKCSRTEHPAPRPEPKRPPLPEALRRPPLERTRSRSPRGRGKATTSREATRPRIISEETGKGLIYVKRFRRH
uniref:Uncharacterized protein n=1 Tax=Trichogramma kaykai TaxID=54128 RepID=A0ABD2VUP6_9HYME